MKRSTIDKDIGQGSSEKKECQKYFKAKADSISTRKSNQEMQKVIGPDRTL